MLSNRSIWLASVLVLSSLSSLFAQHPIQRIEEKSYRFKEAEKEMKYSLFVPSKYDASKKWPLLVALHGLYSSPQQIIRYPKLVELAEEHGFIVVAPMGYNNRGWYGSMGQTSRRSKPRNLGELSEKDVMNVLEIAREDYSVDPSRIYLMGHSMGGAGTFHLGHKYKDIWAALAPIAPAVRQSVNTLEAMKHLPVILVQGEKDRLVKVGLARRWAAKMKKLEMDYKYIEVEGGNHVKPAFTELPKIFKFLAAKKKPEEKSKDADTSEEPKKSKEAKQTKQPKS